MWYKKTIKEISDEFVFSNEEIVTACSELANVIYWDVRNAFCQACCGDECPLMDEPCAECGKLERFVSMLNNN